MKISKIITLKENDINLGMNDLDTVFSHEGFAYIKTINCKKMDECLKKIKNLKFKAKGIMVQFIINEDYPIIELQKFMDTIYTLSHQNADIIMGTKTVENKDIKINLIFTGINLE